MKILTFIAHFAIGIITLVTLPITVPIIFICLFIYAIAELGKDLLRNEKPLFGENRGGLRKSA